MKNLEKMRELMCMTLDDYADKSSISPVELDAVYKMVDIIKDIDTIAAMEDGYSRDYRGTYREEPREMRHSYAKHWVTGHYSRDDVKSDIAERIRSAMDMDGLTGADRSAMRKALGALERN